ncbi:unnamed protein product [Mucor circinelloides]|uniref:Yeast cell wall synthesis Kre9/Knh1-like N-terminal domain-containing protein n=1 Tax=Mucor circinelloides f. circinelloides (strain 1006PhL) TaxID=1220926 RepID=S2K9R8_MUCC1|nr:hypothetical protein HMPREF1544_01003 [Mucor circinelloides 1006PhL]
MKFSLLTAAGVLAAINQATAVTIVTPWASTVWSAGGHGLITWNTTAADANLKCDIYMLNGEFTNSNIVAQITNPATPVDCSVGSYDMYPLNDFASGSYWIRIGQASTGNWAYSSPFKFNGTGAAKPVSVVSGASSAAVPTGSANVTGNAAAAAAAATSSGSKPVTTGAANANKTSSASASASASPAASGASAAMSINAAAVALGAIAAVALTL